MTRPIGGTRTVSRTAPASGVPFTATTWKAWPWRCIGCAIIERFTISIATRAGQDSDCNPSSAAGILGAIIGYSKIPAYWKQGLSAVEPIAFQHAGLSLNDVYGLTFKHALELIRRNGGQVAQDHVTLALQPVKAVRVEQNFAGHFPIAEIPLRRRLSD